jgi:hypothetical protein
MKGHACLGVPFVDAGHRVVFLLTGGSCPLGILRYR